MDRIKELLAKGVGQLSAEELSELNALLAADKVAELTADELSELRDLLAAAGDERLDADEATDEGNAELEVIASGLAAITAEEGTRTAAAEEVANRRRELEAQIRGESSDAEDSDGDGDADASTDGDAEASDGDGSEDGDGDADASADADSTEPAPAVTANAPATVPAVPRRPRVPAQHQPPARVQQAAVVAAGSGRRVQLDNTFDEWNRAVLVAEQMSGGAHIPVLSSRVEFKPEQMLTMNAEHNAALLDKRQRAIVAAGGVCIPVPYRYDFETVGDDRRPVRDALNRVPASRGGIRTFVPPTIDAVSGAFGTWTHANDITPAAPTTKPFLTIGCDNTEVTTMVYAITQGYKVGNFRERWFPEQVRMYQDLMAVYHARYAEAKLLQGIATGSKTITYNDGGGTPGDVISTAYDVIDSLRLLAEAIRYRHRLGSVQIRAIGYEWVRTNMITDIIRKLDGDPMDEKARRVTSATIDAMLASAGVQVTWSPDYQFGVSAGAAGGPFVGTQSTGTPLAGYPVNARFHVFPEGSWLFLDGGELNLGVFRDSGLVATNDLQFFSESFENVHYFGIPGESYNLDLKVCANGGTINPAATMSCSFA